MPKRSAETHIKKNFLPCTGLFLLETERKEGAL